MGVRARFEKIARSDGRVADFYFVGTIVDRGMNEPTAEDLPYPGNVLAYVVNGLRPLDPIIRLPGDGIRGEWLVFRVRGDALVEAGGLRPIEVAQ
jgi:hypothetical protein